MKNKYLFPLFAALISLLPSCVRPDDISSEPLLKLSGRVVTVAAEGGEAGIAFTLSDAGSGKTLDADACFISPARPPGAVTSSRTRQPGR